MKQLSKEKSNSRKNKLALLNRHNTALPSPIDRKYTINGEIFDQTTKKNVFNPYARNFNVRRLNKTQQSKSNSKEKSKQLESSVSSKIEKLIKANKNKEQVKLINPSSNEFLQQKLHKLTNTLDAKRNRHRPNRLQTDHSSLVKKNQPSPYLHKYKFRTIESQIRNNHTSLLDDNFISEKQRKFSYMTKFQLQEIQKYQVYYPGQRRIPSLKYFTDNQGNAKISIGDSIAYRYQIKNPLGQGSFGQVFKSFDHKKKEEVALKIIKNHPKFNRQAKIQIKILQTVLLYDQNSHYNIIKLKHAFIFRGHSCLVFELLHINLYEFLRSNNFKGLTLDLIRRIAIQILQGLMFFQKFNIVHCDLKPQNILLKQQNKTGIKIIDVGSGTFQQQQLYTYIQSRFYRAPQIIMGIRYSNKIDIWSFGCILCELFIGYPIFPGQNQEEQIQMLMETLGVPPPQLIDRGSRSIKFFDQYQPKIVPNSKGKIRTPGSKPLHKRLKNCQDKKFIQFLEKCFRWLPEQRFKPNEALLDEWILEGLPQQIREQHIQIVRSQKFQLQTK